MLWWQFILQFTHFAVHLAMALVFFGVFWLYLDAWLIRRDREELFRLGGYLFLSLSFVASAALVESELFGSVLIGGWSVFSSVIWLRLIGGALLAIGLVLEPIQDRPNMLRYTSSSALILPVIGMSLSEAFSFLLPLVVGLVALLYWRRASIGLEVHVRIISLGYGLLALGELVGLHRVFRKVDIVSVLDAVRPFGLWWFVELLLVVGAIGLVGWWLWHYLLKRVDVQLFMVFVSVIVGIFVITTGVFSALLIRNFQKDSLSSLSTNAKVMQLALSSIKEEAISNAQLLASNEQVRLAVSGADVDLSELVDLWLVERGYSSVLLTDERGLVLYEDGVEVRVDRSLREEDGVSQALEGSAIAGIVHEEGVVVPHLTIQAAVPILDEGQQQGVVVLERAIDASFVDGVKVATGLEVSAYSGEVLVASTLTSGRERRLVGVSETDEHVLQTVLDEGKEFAGSVDVVGVPFFAVYQPLTDSSGEVVGMLMVGEPEYAILQAAGEAVELTFLVVCVMLVLSVAPAHVVSRYIESQLRG